MTGLLEEFRQSAARIEDEIGCLEQKRAALDRDLHSLRTLLRVVREEGETPKRPVARNAVRPYVRAARVILDWPAEEPLTASTLYPRMGLRGPDQARRSLGELLETGILERGPDVRPGGKGMAQHTFRIEDRARLEEIASSR